MSDRTWAAGEALPEGFCDLSFALGPGQTVVPVCSCEWVGEPSVLKQDAIEAWHDHVHTR